MGKTFNYNPVSMFSNEIELESVGNVCLRLTTSLNTWYFLVLRTSLGETTSLEFGPLVPDCELLPDTMIVTFKRFDFSEKTCNSMISKFLANRRIHNLVVRTENVEIISFEEALSYGIDPFKYLMNYSEESNY